MDFNKVKLSTYTPVATGCVKGHRFKSEKDCVLPEGWDHFFCRHCLNELPVTDEELFEVAEKRYDRLGLVIADRTLLVRGYALGMRDGIERLESFGMGDGEIRNALGFCVVS